MPVDTAKVVKKKEEKNQKYLFRRFSSSNDLHHQIKPVKITRG
jgi:hypothetical protein